MTDDDLGVRIAWLYHMDGLTQAEIAARFGITRLRVNRMLTEARESGLVTITVNAGLTDCLALETALRHRFGLAEATVVPSPIEPDRVGERVGAAAALVLSRHLETASPRAIGIGWGSTLRAMVRNVRPAERPDLTVYTLMGGLADGSEINTFEVASGLANRLGARCRYLAAPIYASNPASRDVILAQEMYRDLLDEIAAVDLALIGVGDVSERSLQVRYGLPRGIAAADLVAAGAVGDLLGHFLDRRGAPIAHPLNAQVLGLDLDRFAAVPRVVLVAAGAHKVAIMAAVLTTRPVHGLVTDEATAAALLAADGDVGG
jgi:DNA-binding transcriptional regulator LsrR (DeoR family)